MPEQSVKFTTSGAVGIITLDSPETRNALTPEMIADLGGTVEQCASPNIRAVLLTGAGGAFCAGANVRQLVATLEEKGTDGIAQAIRELADALHTRVVIPLRRLPKPVVAGINGAAAGAGFSLSLAADLRVAAQSARFLMAYANIGAPADGGSTWLLPRLLGVGQAMELYLASQPISAQRALELGLVSQVCADEELDRHALETATRLASGPTIAYGRVKELYERSWGSTLEDQLDAETEAFVRTARTRDFQEGIKAFAERRQPWFQGI
jgi:2-(1,2-epoxy-1,2-dihydrophenyl)acetyl-CoA isomerase